MKTSFAVFAFIMLLVAISGALASGKAYIIVGQSAPPGQSALHQCQQKPLVLQQSTNQRMQHGAKPV